MTYQKILILIILGFFISIYSVQAAPLISEYDCISDPFFNICIDRLTFNHLVTNSLTLLGTLDCNGNQVLATYPNGTVFCDNDDIGGGAGSSLWIDGGAFLYPNSSYADNIIVYGYIQAEDWTNVTITESQITDLAHTTPDNSSWNESLADTLYADIGVVDTQKNASGPYLYNDTTTIYLNETALNNTIDNRTMEITDIWVNESGDTMTGNLNMNANNITNIGVLLTDSGVALGSGDIASTQSTSIAIGDDAQATNIDAVAIGFRSECDGIVSTCLGDYATVTSDSTAGVALGNAAFVFGTSGIALGNNANASSYGLAIGRVARAYGVNSTAIGNEVDVTGNNSGAIGFSMLIDTNNTLGLGFDNVTIFGNLSIAELLSCTELETDGSGQIYCGTDDAGSGTSKNTSGPYLYNDTTTIYFNETYLNNTIDLRENDTTYSHLSNFTDDLGHVQDNTSWNESWADTQYVDVTGDTMTGELIMSGASIRVNEIRTPTGFLTLDSNTYGTDIILNTGRDIILKDSPGNHRVQLVPSVNAFYSPDSVELGRSSYPWDYFYLSNGTFTSFTTCNLETDSTGQLICGTNKTQWDNAYSYVTNGTFEPNIGAQSCSAGDYFYAYDGSGTLSCDTPTDTDTQKDGSNPWLYNDTTTIYANVTQFSNTFVNASGDTITGNLNISTGNLTVSEDYFICLIQDCSKYMTYNGTEIIIQG